MQSDHTGERFGQIIAIKRFPQYKNLRTYYKCLCDCGNEFMVSSSNLVSGHTKSCGCHNISPRRKSVVGTRFGRLIAEEMLYRYNGGKATYVRCRCDCGNESIINMQNLCRGLTKSCGCLERESRHTRNHATNLIGQKFGHLTVLRKTDRKSSNGGAIWKCRCDCGNEIDVMSGNLLRGKTRSCGCNRRSKYEEIVQSILTTLNVRFETEKTFSGCKNVFPLKFDFYLPDYALCIECNGVQHYEPVPFFGGEERFFTVQNNDRIKSDYCSTHNISLLCLPYTLTKNETEEKIRSTLFPCND